MNSFAVKAIAVVGLMLLFIFIFTAFDDTSEEREEAYQEAFDSTQERLRESETLGERETGISDPNDDAGFAEESRATRNSVDDGFENEPTDDWGGADE